MRIEKITIENFRSIKTPISFDVKKISEKNCYIFLGINESGKSNILDAISLLDDSIEIDYLSDCNDDRLPSEEPIQVNYELGIDSISIPFYKKKIIESGLDKNLVEKIDIQNIERRIDIYKDNKKNDYYFVYLKDQKREFSKYVLIGEEILLKTPENTEEDEDRNPKNILDKAKLEKYIEKNFSDLFKQYTPKLIFWKSDPKYLIDGKIDLNQFKEDTKLSIPLKNIFNIAGIGVADIKKRIESISGSSERAGRLESLLGRKITEHINKVWKEHKVQIKIRIEDMKLTFLVEDIGNSDSRYEVKKRSDGFKHFVSILLNLSIENETNRLKNKIILLDEPEIHLHPSGEKYLRDELLKIAKNNVVIFATHSIYMVDKKNLDRHFSVEKESGVTKITRIDKNNPYREEVLYEALGTSVLEHINENVLIFEGKTDRDIFDFYNRKFKSEVKSVLLSTISADGCKNILKYTKFFNTKLVKGFVILDSDQEGKTEKKKILKEKGYNKKNVFEINDISNIKNDSTLEDLFNKKFLLNAINSQFNIEIDVEEKKPFLEQIKKILQENKKPFKDQEKEELKRSFFQQLNKLKKEELKKEPYFKFYETLQSKLKA